MSSATSRSEKVRAAYSAGAERPGDKHPFPIGRAFAASLGYARDTLANLPSEAVEAFSGVSNVGEWADIEPGWTILDLGCGAGLDSLLAARRTGPFGLVVGVDFSASMLLRARKAACRSGSSEVTFVHASASCLSLASKSVNAALVNGIFNLNPDRSAIFSELSRVVKPGGKVWAAELVLTGPLPSQERDDEANWFA